MRPLLKRALLLLASSAFAVILLELALRAFMPTGALSQPFNFDGARRWVITDPVLGWSNRIGFSNRTFSINSHGYRGPEIERQTEGLTVACLGDSGTFGVWIDDEEGEPRVRFDGYVDELRRIGKSRGISQVINAGVVGYTTSNSLRQFVTRLAQLEPDIVTVRLGVNDHRANGNPSRRLSEPSWPRLFYALSDSQLFGIGLRAYRSVPAFHTPPWTSRWVKPPEFPRNLVRIIEEVQKSGAKLLFVDTPLRPLDWGQEKVPDPMIETTGYSTQADFYETHDRYQASLAAVARARNVPLLVTRDELTSADVRHFSSRDFVHPNALGARAIARQMLEEFDRLGWLDR